MPQQQNKSPFEEQEQKIKSLQDDLQRAQKGLASLEVIYGADRDFAIINKKFVEEVSNLDYWKKVKGTTNKIDTEHAEIEVRRAYIKAYEDVKGELNPGAEALIKGKFKEFFEKDQPGEKCITMLNQSECKLLTLDERKKTTVNYKKINASIESKIGKFGMSTLGVISTALALGISTFIVLLPGASNKFYDQQVAVHASFTFATAAAALGTYVIGKGLQYCNDYQNRATIKENKEILQGRDALEEQLESSHKQMINALRSMSRDISDSMSRDISERTISESLGALQKSAANGPSAPPTTPRSGSPSTHATDTREESPRSGSPSPHVDALRSRTGSRSQSSSRQ